VRHLKAWLKRFVSPWTTVSLARISAHRKVVETSQGKLIGTVHGFERHLYEFKGIPYAVPPVGNRRWKPPEAAGGWSGERLATRFGPDCVQTPYETTSFYYRPSRPTSEDCLYLNIWTTKLSGKLPVIVWIHGGALTRGSAAIDLYDGTHLARKDVVVVSINYRLGIFGYFAHPDLIAESEHGAAGNYGVLDQIEALRWVRENISEFGGDPDNVTICGQSAGAWSVSVLSASPLATGLFHKVIAQSGGRLDRRPELEAAAEAGTKLARDIGKTSINELRDMPALDLLAAADKAQFQSDHIVDGWVLPKQPYEIFAAGEQNAVPSLLGFNQDEGTTLGVAAFVPPNEFMYRGHARTLYGDLADDYLSVYPPTDLYQACLDGFRDYWFGWQAVTWARMTEDAGQEAYLYRFAHSPPGRRKRKKELRAYHAGEVAYVFNNIELFGSRASVADFELADLMSSFWASFARTGVPAVKGENTWASFGSGRQLYMLFEDGRAIIYADLFQDRVKLWDSIMAMLRSKETR
jgi:para-nitrobenzyl esterase